MRALVDTNVVLDVLLAREPHDLATLFEVVQGTPRALAVGDLDESAGNGFRDDLSAVRVGVLPSTMCDQLDDDVSRVVCTARDVMVSMGTSASRPVHNGAPHS